MALTVTLSEVKEHLRVDQSTEDTLIQTYIDASIEWINQYLNTLNYPDNATIKTACFMLVAGLYENREAQGEKEIKENPAIKNLLQPYRRGIGI